MAFLLSNFDDFDLKSSSKIVIRLCFKMQTFFIGAVYIVLKYLKSILFDVNEMKMRHCGGHNHVDVLLFQLHLSNGEFDETFAYLIELNSLCNRGIFSFSWPGNSHTFHQGNKFLLSVLGFPYLPCLESVSRLNPLLLSESEGFLLRDSEWVCIKSNGNKSAKL